MAVNLKKIAKLTGLHESTISRALADSPRVKEDTRKKIHALAKKLNYKPHAVARSLALKKTNILGVVVPNIMGSFIHEIVQGIESVASRKGYNIILCISNENPEKEATEVRLLTYKRADGLIIFSIAEDDTFEHIKELQQEEIPFVLIDRYLKDITADYVGVDNIGGAYAATRHLLELGHRRIGFLNEPENFSVLKERLKGYRKAHKEYGVEVDKELIKNITSRRKFVEGRIDKNSIMKSAYKAAGEFFEMKDRPTAIFGINDDIAAGVILAAKDRGLDVPEDIAVVGFDDLQISSMVSLTTVAQPKFEMGATAAKILINRIESPPVKDFKKVILKPELVIRQSCGFAQG